MQFVLRLLRSVAVPVLAIVTAFAISGVIIWVSTGFDWAKVIGPQGAFVGLWQGSIGSSTSLIDARHIAETLTTATPYIFAGLAVALAFKCGLFNIGAEGQLALGAICAAFVGYNYKELPFPLHMPLTLGAGLLGGMVGGAIAGLLNAFRGAQ